MLNFNFKCTNSLAPLNRFSLGMYACCYFQILSLIVFICASVNGDFIPEGGGWVQFTSITAFILIIVLLVSYVFGFIYNLPHSVPRDLIVSRQ